MTQDVESNRKWLAKNAPDLTTYGPEVDPETGELVMMVKADRPLSAEEQQSIAARFRGGYPVRFGQAKPIPYQTS